MQVHTTGMDIKHVLDAKAVLTISKDMVFRDIAQVRYGPKNVFTRLFGDRRVELFDAHLVCSSRVLFQGAYRMRGINKGQTVHMLVIPEVRDLILRELRRGRAYKTEEEAAISSSHWGQLQVGAESQVPQAALLAGEEVRKVLCDISAWLVVNSMRSERVQFNQLCIQNVSNVYRKSAYSVLLKEHPLLKVGENYAMDAEPSTPTSSSRRSMMQALQVRVRWLIDV